jgi:SOS-response transcriptional repressor LexA
MIGLTPRMRRTMLAIQQLFDERGYCPSLAEIAARLGRGGKGGLSIQLRLIAARGWLRLKPGRARSIELLHRIDDSDDGDPEIVGLFDAPDLFTARDLSIIAELRAAPPLEQGEENI